MWGRAYRTDGQPDLQVAEDDDDEGQDTAGGHKHHHVGLDIGVRVATEDVWPT